MFYPRRIDITVSLGWSCVHSRWRAVLREDGRAKCFWNFPTRPSETVGAQQVLESTGHVDEQLGAMFGMPLTLLSTNLP